MFWGDGIPVTRPPSRALAGRRASREYTNRHEGNEIRIACLAAGQKHWARLLGGPGVPWTRRKPPAARRYGESRGAATSLEHEVGTIHFLFFFGPRSARARTLYMAGVLVWRRRLGRCELGEIPPPKRVQFVHAWPLDPRRPGEHLGQGLPVHLRVGDAAVRDELSGPWRRQPRCPSGTRAGRTDTC